VIAGLQKIYSFVYYKLVTMIQTKTIATMVLIAIATIGVLTTTRVNAVVSPPAPYSSASEGNHQGPGVSTGACIQGLGGSPSICTHGQTTSIPKNLSGHPTF
jgi:hypothetical protein